MPRRLEREEERRGSALSTQWLSIVRVEGGMRGPRRKTVGEKADDNRYERGGRGRDGLRKALFTCHRLRDYYESLFPHESESLRRVPLYRPSRPPNGGISFAPRKHSTTLVSPILYSFSNLLNAFNFFSSL